MTVSTSGAKCTVGLKYPHGLVLNLYADKGKKNRENETIMDRVAGPVEINGINIGHRAGKVVAGAGVTENVDADFMDQWLKDNAESDLVKKGLIFIGKRTDVVAEAKDKAEVMTLQPIDPDHPERHNGPDTTKAVAADNYEGMAQKDE